MEDVVITLSILTASIIGGVVGRRVSKDLQCRSTRPTDKGLPASDRCAGMADPRCNGGNCTYHCRVHCSTACVIGAEVDGQKHGH